MSVQSLHFKNILPTSIFLILFFIQNSIVPSSAQNQIQAYNRISFAQGFLAYANDIETNGKAGMGAVGTDVDPQSGISHNPANLVNSRKYLFVRVNATKVKTNNSSSWDNAGFFSGSFACGIDSVQSVAFEGVYHRSGFIQMVDSSSGEIRKYPNMDLVFGARYARRISKRCRIGLGLKYYYSNYGLGFTFKGKKLLSQGVSTDWGIVWKDKFGLKTEKKIAWGIGLLLQNLGPKVGIDAISDSKQFLPQNLRVGSIIGFVGLDQPHTIKVFLGYELNKWLIPSPPIKNGTTLIRGINDKVSSFAGVFQSFYDAPYGIQEELAEMNHLFSLEINQLSKKNWYWAIRSGFYYAPISKGGIHYLSFGASLSYKRTGFSAFYRTNFSRSNSFIREPFGCQLSYLLNQ